MSFDLFFVPKGANFSKVRAAGYKVTAGQRKAFSTLFDALGERFPRARFVAADHSERGSVDNFPFGRLEQHGGYLLWSLSGELPDERKLHDMVEWFREQGFACEDPQDAGFGNDGRKKSAKPRGEALQEWEQLVRSRIRAFSMDIPGGQTLVVEFRLPDDRVCKVRYIGAVELAIPADQRKLYEGAIVSIRVDKGEIFDRYAFDLDNGLSFGYLAAGAVEAKIHDENP